eukprot:3223980-Rhodomonas_salina.1
MLHRDGGPGADSARAELRVGGALDRICMSCSARNVLILPQSTTSSIATVTGVTSFLILDQL